jgi:3-hydroxyisobutyrate dehydrogenase-like beta-hydroxyacid dehydrogenase
VIRRIALIGYGEVGQTLEKDLVYPRVDDIAVWDIAFTDPQSAPSRAAARRAVRTAANGARAAQGADLVISAVTAAQGFAAAQAVASGLEPGAYFLDLNSCSPGQKLASADVISRAGGRYIDAAVMSPIRPRDIASPMLLGGPDAPAFLAAAEGLGFAGAMIYSETVGQAAAAKLCRSVMIKGVEALLAESLLSARHFGVEQVVLDTLSDLLPLPDWNVTAHYMISRSLEHGVRRAEEMREAARTVEEAGVQPLMCAAIAARQDWAGAHKSALHSDLIAMLDAINQTHCRSRA